MENSEIGLSQLKVSGPDYSELLRISLNAAIFAVLGPEEIITGLFLSDLLGVLWPESGEDVWAEIKSKVEDMINQKMDAALYEQVVEDLMGLQNVANDYISSINDGYNVSEVLVRWISLNSFILNAKPHFQTKGSEFLLLPLFAQFANLEFAILRDMVGWGLSWGCSDKEVLDYKTKLSSYIKEYTTYVDKVYSDKLATINPAPGQHRLEPFTSRNKITRETTLSVLDYKELWKYLDLNDYPTPPDVIVLDREIYSDPFGTADDNGISIPSKPSNPPSEITIWGWDRVDAIQVDYEVGKGPGGITSTGRMGDVVRPDNHGGTTGGSNQPPHGGSWKFTTDPITHLPQHGGFVDAVMVYSGSIVNGIQLRFGGIPAAPGTWSNLCGGYGSTNTMLQYSSHYLSSIKVMGASHYYGSADCVVFGFKIHPILKPETSSFSVSSNTVSVGGSVTATFTGFMGEGATYDWGFEAEYPHPAISKEQVSGVGGGPYVVTFTSPGTYNITLVVTSSTGQIFTSILSTILVTN